MKLRRLFFLSALFAVFLGPVSILALYSVAGVWRFPDLLPEFFNVRALIFLRANFPGILRSILSSVGYSFATVALTFSLTVLPAKTLARKQIKMKSMIEALLLAPALLPSITFSMGVHIIFVRWHLTGTYFGVIVILSLFTFPYMLRALISGYQAVSPNLEAAARGLGGSRWYTLRRVELPLLVPAMVAGGTVVFLIAFSEYFLVFLIGGGAVPSYAGYLFPFLNSSDHQIASSLTLVFLIVPLFLFFAIEASIGRTHRKMGLVH